MNRGEGHAFFVRALGCVTTEVKKLFPSCATRSSTNVVRRELAKLDKTPGGSNDYGDDPVAL